jgi:hypothetical protein
MKDMFSFMSLNITRYDLVQHDRVLATRQRGQEVGRAVADQLAEADGLLLSFWEVDVATPSFLDEVLRALRAVLLPPESKWLLVTGYNEDVKESIEMVLARQKLSLAALAKDQIALLGGSSQLAETLREAQKSGVFTAPDLSKRLRLKLPALHQRLNELVKSGAITREDDPTALRGKRSRYHAPRPEDLGHLGDPPRPGDVRAVTA